MLLVVWMISDVHASHTFQGRTIDQFSASLQAGLAVISILARGNDYLPGVGQLSLTSTQSRTGVWSAYLKLKQEPEWKERCASFPNLSALSACLHVKQNK